MKKIVSRINAEEPPLLHLYIDRLTKGDHAAFWSIWCCYEQDLTRCCRAWLNNDAFAVEEARSRAMFRAWDKLPLYAAQISNLKAWLYQLTYHICMELHRERQKDLERHVDIDALVSDEDDSLVVAEDSPEPLLLRNEVAQRLVQAVAQLPSHLQEPFVLRFYEEQSCQDIAQQLGLTLDTVYKRIQQARERLQTLLQTNTSPPPPTKSAEQPSPIPPNTLYELSTLCLIPTSPA